MGLTLSKFRGKKTQPQPPILVPEPQSYNCPLEKLINEDYFEHEDEPIGYWVVHYSKCNKNPLSAWENGSISEPGFATDSEKDETYDYDGEDPLLNYMIVKKVLSFLSHQELNAVRLVNTFWEDLAEFWILRGRDVEVPIRIKKENIAQFCTLFDVETSPRYFFVNFIIAELDEISLEDCTNFFTQFGSMIRKLRLTHATRFLRTGEVEDRLNWDDEEFVEGFQEKFRFMLRNIKNLEHLEYLGIPICFTIRPFAFSPEEVAVNQLLKVESLKFYVADYPDNPLEPVEFMSGLMALMPNITAVDPHIRGEFRPFVYAIRNHRISELFCPDVFPVEFFTLLKSHNIECLRLSSTVATDNQAADFLEFLESQRTTLKSLDMNVYCSNTSHWTDRIPNMPVLKNLAIEHSPFPAQSWITSISQTAQIPKVCHLTICLDCIQSPFLHTVFPSVHALHLTNDAYKRGHAHANVVKTLGTMFPGLRILNFTTNMMKANCLTAVFSTFHNLTFLDLTVNNNRFKRNINLLLAGISYTTDTSSLRMPDMAMPEFERAFDFSTLLPSIRDLKNLKDFSLTFVKFNKKVFELDDIGVHMGLMKMKRLNELVITGQFKISSENVNHLKKYHSLVRIEPTPPYSRRKCYCAH